MKGKRIVMPGISICLVLMIVSLGLTFGCDDEPVETGPYDPDYCAFFITGEIDTEGTDADGDGVTNNWDFCPNNAFDWLDSDRDGIGNLSDDDMDGDGIDNDSDDDMDGDNFSNDDEEAAGSDPKDPSSIPDVEYYDYDQGAMNAEPGWYCGDLHNHTTYSDGAVTVAEMLETAELYAFDYHAITDHNDVDHFYDADYESDTLCLVTGYEWSNSGHANVFGIRTTNLINRSDQYDIDIVMASWNATKLQGGIISVNHYAAPDYYLYWDEMLPKYPEMKEMIDCVEVWNGWWVYSAVFNPASIEWWEGLLNEGYKIGAIGGSDSHAESFPICFPTTYVYADNLSSLAILKGIREGRTFVCSAYPYEDGGAAYYNLKRPMIDFEANRGRAMIGDTVALGDISFTIEITNAHGYIRVVKNGEIIQEFVNQDYIDSGIANTVEYSFTDTATEASWYRVDMFASTTAGAHRTLITSPIYAE